MLKNLFSGFKKSKAHSVNNNIEHVNILEEKSILRVFVNNVEIFIPDQGLMFEYNDNIYKIFWKNPELIEISTLIKKSGEMMLSTLQKNSSSIENDFKILLTDDKTMKSDIRDKDFIIPEINNNNCKVFIKDVEVIITSGGAEKQTNDYTFIIFWANNEIISYYCKSKDSKRICHGIIAKNCEIKTDNIKIAVK